MADLTPKSVTNANSEVPDRRTELSVAGPPTNDGRKVDSSHPVLGQEETHLIHSGVTTPASHSRKSNGKRSGMSRPC